VISGRHSIRLARIGLDLYEEVDAITSQTLDGVDADLLQPMRSQIVLALDWLDTALLEVAHHGRSYPHGKPRLRLASDPPDTKRVRKAA
jgi:hypothetical protein